MRMIIHVETGWHVVLMMTGVDVTDGHQGVTRLVADDWHLGLGLKHTTTTTTTTTSTTTNTTTSRTSIDVTDGHQGVTWLVADNWHLGLCLIECLHNPANIQLHPANVQHYGCWKFAGSCKHPIKHTTALLLQLQQLHLQQPKLLQQLM